ncbi:hypothetical protein O3P69_000179 [Scylla paramamosain]|uniref:J domain-containing protein n=1 Tax=Scylla paramamosain TaxID=85552 RepID=A0AAW0UW49_SCYPA
MASSVILAGLGLAAVGFGARFVIRTIPALGKKMADTVYNVPKLDSKFQLDEWLSTVPSYSKTSLIWQIFASSKYYKGGFEPKMTKREAALILNVSPNASQQKVRAAYKRMMLTNHPDRGGSPFISSKLSEAKDLLDK